MVKKSALFIAGIILIILGIAGFVLPLIPGAVLFVMGILFISKASPAVKRLFSRLKQKFPHQYEWLNRLKDKI